MKKYIFDFDGTLVDSMTQWSVWILKRLDELKIEYPDDIIKIVSPLGTRGAAQYLIELGVEATVDDLLEMMDDFALNEYTYNIPPKAFVVDKLKELKAKGYSLNVFTACNHNLLDVCLKRIGIYDIFDNIWSCEQDLSMSKTQVEAYYEIAKKLDTVVENCIFVDDNIGAITTAHKAGMITVGVFDETSEDYIDIMRSVADRYIFDFSEL